MNKTYEENRSIIKSVKDKIWKLECSGLCGSELFRVLTLKLNEDELYFFNENVKPHLKNI